MPIFERKKCFSPFSSKNRSFLGRKKKFDSIFFVEVTIKNITLPDESRDQIRKSQEIWDWLVHPPHSRVNINENLSSNYPQIFSMFEKVCHKDSRTQHYVNIQENFMMQFRLMEFSSLLCSLHFKASKLFPSCNRTKFAS